MPDEFDELLSREVEAMAIFLRAKVSRTAISLDEYIQTRMLLGASKEEIKKELIDDLENDGRLFSELKRMVSTTVRGSVNRVRDNSYFSQFGTTLTYRWSAIMVKTCPDCIERHGMIKTWEEWEAVGLPRTGATVCRENCHCVLIPEEYSHIEPIQRKPRR